MTSAVGGMSAPTSHQADASVICCDLTAMTFLLHVGHLFSWYEPLSTIVSYVLNKTFIFDFFAGNRVIFMRRCVVLLFFFFFYHSRA